MSVRFCIKDRRPLALHFVRKSCGEPTVENDGESSSENDFHSKNDARPQLTFVEILACAKDILFCWRKARSLTLSNGNLKLFDQYNIRWKCRLVRDRLSKRYPRNCKYEENREGKDGFEKNNAMNSAINTIVKRDNRYAPPFILKQLLTFTHKNFSKC